MEVNVCIILTSVNAEGSHHLQIPKVALKRKTLTITILLSGLSGQLGRHG